MDDYGNAVRLHDGRKSLISKTNVIKARKWAKEHGTHVLNLVFSVDDEGYPPSREDEGHPELWKPEHWSWFFVNKI
jgi:hypothetical protein